MSKDHKLFINTYPFSFLVSSPFPFPISNLKNIYSHEIISEEGVADFRVGLLTPSVAGIPLFKTCLFHLDGFTPFTRGPKAHSHALLEWGMNWCVSQFALDRLIIHSACVAKGAVATLISGDSGSGKSTLSCALMHESFRLLTDELSLVNVDDASVTPFVRPVSLKEKAIEVIKSGYPESSFGVVATNTHKGTVSHCKPTSNSWKNMHENANVKFVIFPKFNIETEKLEVTRLDGIELFKRLSEQSFNVNMLGFDAVKCLQHLSETTAGFELEYNNMDEAIHFIKMLYEQ